MPRIPLPERGQPIDVSYLYQITSEINRLSDRVNAGSFNQFTLDVPGIAKQNVPTAESRVLAAVVSVNASDVKAGETKEFSYSYNGNFKYVPVATATVVNNVASGTTGNAGNNVIVTLTDVNTNSLTGLIRFNVATNVNVSVNLIIVGIPN
jgi:hypothetical protein